MVRHGKSEAEQFDEGADEPLYGGLEVKLIPSAKPSFRKFLYST